jgi:hypothetical protein
MQLTKMQRGAVVGFTSDRIVMLDLDGCGDARAVTICQYILRRWNLGGYLLLKSSPDNKHAVFDKPTNWRRVMQIVFSLVFKYRPNQFRLRGWAIMQAIKGSCTLRIGPKGKKKPPAVIARVGTQHRAIKEYLDVRKSLGY